MSKVWQIRSKDEMINPKILFIVFGVIACASVTSLIIYDQWTQVQNEMVIPTVTSQLDFTDEEERQRKINSLIPPEPFHDDPAIVEYWNRAQITSFPKENNVAYNACVNSIMGKHFTPSTAEDFYKLAKAQQVCEFMKPDYEEDFTANYEECLMLNMEIHTSPLTPEESLEIGKAHEECNKLFDFTEDFEIDYTEKFE